MLFNKEEREREKKIQLIYYFSGEKEICIDNKIVYFGAKMGVIVFDMTKVFDISTNWPISKGVARGPFENEYIQTLKKGDHNF